MKIAIVLGTRPEIIKMSSIIRECCRKNFDFFIIHSNQHYSPEMDKIFFEELELTKPKYNLNVGSGTHGNQTGNILIKIEEIFMEEKPSIVLAQGDTNTVLACALAAAKLGITVGHIEAGLRSYNQKMPEETNRIVTDHVSDYLFCPTEKQKQILINEGIAEDKIFVVGNTIVDAVFQNIELAESRSEILDKLNLTRGEYILVTAHRSLNVDQKSSLENLINSLKVIIKKYPFPLVYPVHPRTKKMIELFNIDISGLKLVPPLGYLDFLKLQKNAKIILTDSGGLQEEACVLKVPCITLREDTERPETLEVGSNILTGTEVEKICAGIENMLEKNNDWDVPYGKGDSGEQIMGIIMKKQDETKNIR